ncbi:unnamed protein product [Aphanomyces euteiches]
MSASSLSPAKSTTSSFDGDYYNHVRQANILSMRRYYAKNRDKELQRFKAYYIQEARARTKQTAQDVAVVNDSNLDDVHGDWIPLQRQQQLQGGHHHRDDRRDAIFQTRPRVRAELIVTCNNVLFIVSPMLAL